jgi:hypothetical protein
MSESTYTDSELFAGGPPVRLERSLGLIKPDNPRIIHRAILARLFEIFIDRPIELEQHIGRASLLSD